MSNLMQQTINRLSLVMTIPEDIVKVCKEVDVHPKLVELFLKLHNQQFELEKAINEMRATMLLLSQVVERQADFAGNVSTTLMDMSKHIGYAPGEVASTSIKETNG
jgi:hypothetical protein